MYVYICLYEARIKSSESKAVFTVIESLIFF